jgi:hypothetical protein
MTSKPTGDERPEPVYPKLRAHPEETLLQGYSGLAHRRGRSGMAPRPEKRPLGPVYDESGLAYGEPISKGRTDLQEGKER